jgi:hypothetical protein
MQHAPLETSDRSYTSFVRLAPRCHLYMHAMWGGPKQGIRATTGELSTQAVDSAGVPAGDLRRGIGAPSCRIGLAVTAGFEQSACRGECPPSCMAVRTSGGAGYLSARS